MVLLDPNSFKSIMNLKIREYQSIMIIVILSVLILIALFANLVKSSDVSSAIAVALVTGIGGALVWGFRSRITGKSGDHIKKEKLSDNIDIDSRNQEKMKNKEKVKSKLKITVDDYKFYEFNLRKSERITGMVSSDGIFNMYFLTKSSLRSFQNGGGFSSIDAIEDAHYFEPNFVAPRKDIFFTVIENADKKNIIVDIELYV